MHKNSKALSRLGILLLVMSLISFLVFYLVVMMSQQGYTYIDPDTLELIQTEEIPEGAPTAIFETSLGEFRAVLYPEQAPETVGQFVKLAEAGVYDNTYIFEAKQDVYFAAGAGDAAGSLANGVTDAQELVPLEKHQNLWPLKGALCAMNTTSEGGFFARLFKNTKQYSGSRFMVLGSVDFTDEEFLTQFREASGNALLADTFVEWGGVPNFSQQMTVFGQTYAGLDVLDAILSAPLLEEMNVNGYTPPKEEIQILSVTISTYGEEDAARNELTDRPTLHEKPTETE